MILLMLAACLPDDWTGDTGSTDTDVGVDTSDTDTTDVDTGDPSAPDPALAGSWVSTGSDLSPLFVQLDIQRVEATFRANGTYLVVSQDESGQEGSFTGTYAVTAGNPSRIVLTQATPYEGTAEGLYEVDSGVLTYETVQTQPDFGNNPPQGSFGTSSGNGLQPGDNVQTYRAAR